MKVSVLDSFSSQDECLNEAFDMVEKYWGSAKMEELVEYLKVRERRLSILIGGLINSKRRCGNSGNWTKDDEHDLVKLKGMQKECQEVKAILTGKGTQHKDIQFFIDKELKDIERIKNRRKR
jgi:hypothetical protein